MQILVACEESQAVTIALRKLGHEAYSCDLIPCSGGHPEWHIQRDVLPLLNGYCFFKTCDGSAHYVLGRWDMLIAFPPCTYLTNASAVRMRVKGEIVAERYAKALGALFGARFLRTMHNVGEGAWIGGKSWLYPYYENGELAFRRFPADEVLPFWADADHTILDAAVHVYVVQEYDEAEHAKDVVKVEVMHGGGVDCFIRTDDGVLEPDSFAYSGPYIITRQDDETGKVEGYNWERIPLVCFKSSHHEIPLLSKVKCLQDAYNNILSNFANQMEEDIHTTILVIKNYDGEDLGTFRRNLATYGAIKVRSYEGAEGGVDTLEISVNAENYHSVKEDCDTWLTKSL